MAILRRDHCPVCEKDLRNCSLLSIVLSTPRGKQAWAKCPGCRSFFSAEGYDSEEEVRHTRTRPWGMAQSGIALNDEKNPMFNAIVRLISRYAPEGSTLLDVGCSFGGFLLRAQEEGYKVRGMDIIPEAVEYVSSRGIDCDRAASVGDLDIPESSLGIVTALDSNYYWPEQRKELRLIHSRLKPDGIFAVRTVDTSWAILIGLWLRHIFPKAGLDLCSNAVYDHRVSVPARSLLNIVQQEGFEIVYASPRDALPFRHNSLKVKIAYAVGQLVWLTSGYNLAPGFVFLARKRTV